MEFVACNPVINNLRYFTTGFKADLNIFIQENKIMFALHFPLIEHGIYSQCDWSEVLSLQVGLDHERMPHLIPLLHTKYTIVGTEIMAYQPIQIYF